MMKNLKLLLLLPVQPLLAAGNVTCVNKYVCLTDLTAQVTGVLPLANGGTGLSAAADDTVMVSTGTAWVAKVLTTCTGAGKAVTYDASTNTFGCNTISSAAAGSDTQVQFNDGGNFGGDAGFTYNKTTDIATLAAGLHITNAGSCSEPVITGHAGFETSGFAFGNGAINLCSLGARVFEVYGGVAYSTDFRPFSDDASDQGSPTERFRRAYFSQWIRSTVRIQAKAASYVVVAGDSGNSHINNSGATGAATYDLPAATGSGLEYTFCRVATQSMVLDPNTTNLIKFYNGGGAITTTNGGTLSIDQDYCCVHLVDEVAGIYVSPDPPVAACYTAS